MPFTRTVLAGLAAAGLGLAAAQPAAAQSLVEAGTMNCTPVGATVTGGAVPMDCAYAPVSGAAPTRYRAYVQTGRAGYVHQQMTWNVMAPNSGVAMHPEYDSVLIGTYAPLGGTPQASEPVYLRGGPNGTVILRPVHQVGNDVSLPTRLVMTPHAGTDELVDPFYVPGPRSSDIPH